ncbi:MAG TPA: carboxypeptidase-like regulatory domain-containing protein [Gemmataceae bacterium]|nr:carboxypeptidase-like regulatory domain-containing protein [Gemmataceae bacterium]
MFLRSDLFQGLLVTALGCLVVGCSQDPAAANRPKVVPAGGQVLYRSQAVEGAHVTFMNAEANQSGYGVTDADGRFTLTTFREGDGVVPGRQKISIRKVEVIDRSKPGFDYSASSEIPPPAEERWLIPKRYGRFETSGLTVEVREGGKNEFILELKD